MHEQILIHASNGQHCLAPFRPRHVAKYAQMEAAPACIGTSDNLPATNSLSACLVGPTTGLEKDA